MTPTVRPSGMQRVFHCGVGQGGGEGGERPRALFETVGQWRRRARAPAPSEPERVEGLWSVDVCVMTRTLPRPAEPRLPQIRSFCEARQNGLYGPWELPTANSQLPRAIPNSQGFRVRVLGFRVPR